MSLAEIFKEAFRLRDENERLKLALRTMTERAINSETKLKECEDGMKQIMEYEPDNPET